MENAITNVIDRRARKNYIVAGNKWIIFTKNDNKGCVRLTIAEKKTELEKYRDLWKDIKCLEDDILRLESASEKVTSIISDLPRVQCTKDKMVVVDDIIIKKEKLQQKISEAMAKREYIENAIDRVDNSLYRRVLRYRYINGASFEEISVKENYNYKYITSTIHPKALESIEFDSMIWPNMVESTILLSYYIYWNKRKSQG